MRSSTRLLPPLCRYFTASDDHPLSYHTQHSRSSSSMASMLNAASQTTASSRMATHAATQRQHR